MNPLLRSAVRRVLRPPLRRAAATTTPRRNSAARESVRREVRDAVLSRSVGYMLGFALCYSIDKACRRKADVAPSKQGPPPSDAIRRRERG